MFQGTADLDFTALKPQMKTLNSIDDLPITADLVIMAKADGEFTFLRYERNSESYTVNRNGHWRTDFPALNELVKAMNRTSIQEAEMLCELFAVDDMGNPLILPDFIHAIKGQDKQLRNRVHIGVWDLLKVNDRPVTQDYVWKIEELKRWLQTSSGCRLERAYVLPRKIAPTKKEVEDFWFTWVQSVGYEGIVARNETDIYKIKPMREVDAVIIALNKVDSTGKPTKRWREQKVSTVRVALMPGQNVLLEIGDCTVANPEIQSALWKLHKHKVSENNERVYVEPLVIMQIRYTSIFDKSRCRLWKYSKEYNLCGFTEFAKLRHPRFMRFRPDKTVCPEDLRLEQVRNGE